MPVSMIEIEELVKDYGKVRAVDHLNFKINEGEIYGLLGPNGAGKTTAILTMLGLSEPTEGTVRVKGYNSTSEPLKVKRITGYLPDDVGFSDNRTGLECLVYTAMLNGIPRSKAVKSARKLLVTVGLEKAQDKKTGTYSKGMIQRLGLADVLIKDPEIVILDEPTIGIDPRGIIEFLDLIRDLSKDKGITVLLSSHLLHQVQKICDRVGILVNGKLLAEGNINELADKLFKDKEAIIKARVSNITGELINKLLQEENINDVKRDGDLLIIEGKKEVTPLIAETVINYDGKLHRLSYEEYGLDEIYQYYFEGGDGND